MRAGDSLHLASGVNRFTMHPHPINPTGHRPLCTTGMKSALTRQILAVARDLFMQKGFEAVGMRDIARAVGLQPTQVYRLKLSKTDILAEIILTLNNELIATLSALLQGITGRNALERTSAYLLALYRFDIEHLPLRSVGAMHGWSWSPAYEAAVVAQVLQFLAPIASWMQEDGLGDVSARCYAIWSLYYVGYRRAVIHGANAQECLAEIQPSLAILIPCVASPGPTTTKAHS